VPTCGVNCHLMSHCTIAVTVDLFGVRILTSFDALDTDIAIHRFSLLLSSAVSN